MNTNIVPWIDLETTGLNPDFDQIVEVGIILTTPTLQEVARFSACVSMLAIDRRRIEDKVWGMHEASGLWGDCRKSMHAVEDVERLTLEFLREHAALGCPMYGANVAAFDRQFLRIDMPDLEKVFHYRNCDVNAFRVQAARLGIECPPKRERHRPFPDIEDSIDLQRWADRRLQLGSVSVALSSE